MKLTPNQAQRLADIRYGRCFGLPTFNLNDLPEILLDIIDTLQQPEPTTAPQPERHTDFEWRDSGPQGPNWYKKQLPR